MGGIPLQTILVLVGDNVRGNEGGDRADRHWGRKDDDDPRYLNDTTTHADDDDEHVMPWHAKPSSSAGGTATPFLC